MRDVDAMGELSFGYDGTGVRCEGHKGRTDKECKHYAAPGARHENPHQSPSPEVNPWALKPD
jgi:hypothetical protein